MPGRANPFNTLKSKEISHFRDGAPKTALRPPGTLASSANASASPLARLLDLTLPGPLDGRVRAEILATSKRP